MPVGPFKTFDDCIKAQMDKGHTKLSAQKICGEIEKKSQGSKQMKKQILNYCVPIENSITKNNEFIIRGTAINSTTTRNGVKYTSEELSKSAGSLSNKPILKDHSNSVDSIIGRTTNAFFENDKVMFEGKIMDKEIQQKIKQGLITSVSVGAMVEETPYIEDEDGEETGIVEAKGIDFVEISLVAIPADPNAGLAQAILNSIKSSSQISEKTEIQEVKMTEEKVSEKKEAISMEEMFSKLSELIDNKISNLKTEEAEEEPKAEAEPEEAPAEEESKEEVEEKEEDTTKGEVGEAEPEVSEESLSNEAVVGYDKEGLCKGVTISRENYDGFKRLSNTSRYEWE